MLFQLRYRTYGGIKEPYIEAKDMATAVRVGQRYCEVNQGFKYIGVGPMIVADESILGEPKPVEPVQDYVPKPTLDEQKTRISRQSHRIGA